MLPRRAPHSPTAIPHLVQLERSPWDDGAAFGVRGGGVAGDLILHGGDLLLTGGAAGHRDDCVLVPRRMGRPKVGRVTATGGLVAEPMGVPCHPGRWSPSGRLLVVVRARPRRTPLVMQFPGVAATGRRYLAVELPADPAALALISRRLPDIDPATGVAPVPSDDHAERLLADLRDHFGVQLKGAVADTPGAARAAVDLAGLGALAVVMPGVDSQLLARQPDPTDRRQLTLFIMPELAAKATVPAAVMGAERQGATVGG
jgi:hypothetical protein